MEMSNHLSIKFRITEGLGQKARYSQLGQVASWSQGKHIETDNHLHL